MKVSDFVHCSNLVAKLVNDGSYDGDTEFGTFLQEFGIPELADDVAAVLLSASSPTPSPIPIDRVIEILDELAAPNQITMLAKQRIKLNRISDTQIINHALTDTRDIANAYIDGYRVICDSNTNEINFESRTIIDSLPIAIDNGLSVTRISSHTCVFDSTNIHENNLKDITRLQFGGDTASHNNDNLSKCTNLRDLDMSNICIAAIDTTPFAKTLETLRMTNCVTMPDNMISQCPKLRSLYIDEEQSYTLSHNSFPKDLRILSICNSKFVAVRQILDRVVTQPYYITKLHKRLHAYNEYNYISISDMDGGIGDAELQCCTKIKKLYAINNPYVTSCNPFCKTLKVLHVTHDWDKHDRDKYVCSKMGDIGLQLCIHIKELNASANKLITTCVPFAHTLRTLIADKESGICDDGLKMCNRLRKVNFSNNEYVTTCAPFAKSLEVLIITGSRGKIRDDGVASCSKIKHLNVSDNPHIHTCNPFAKTLKILSVSSSTKKLVNHTCGFGNDGFGNDGLKLCTNIKHLSIYGNKRITSCEPFAGSLETLIAHASLITDEGIFRCTKLKRLSITDTRITTIMPFKNTLIELSIDKLDHTSDKNRLNEIKMCTNIKKIFMYEISYLKMNDGRDLWLSKRIYYDVFSDAVAMRIL